MPKTGGDGKDAKTYDVTIVGAGPAGATAAMLLVRKGHQVVLVDRAVFPQTHTSVGWLNARTLPLLEELGVSLKNILAQAFDEVIFYNADLTKSAKPNFHDTPGYLLDRTRFANVLAEHARRTGADLIGGSTAARLTLRESTVRMELDAGRELESRLLVLASGTRSELIDQAGFPRVSGSGVVWSAQVDHLLTKTKKETPRVVVVLGLDRRGGFVIFCLTADRISATANWFGEREGVIKALTDVCRATFEKGIIPVDLSKTAASAALHQNPVAAALDMDTHVGKHCLLIGDAGGFISAASQEGLYPAMWSAQIAAEVVDEALRSRHSQDTLKGFDTAWRIKMADYLRSPNTDPQFLVPLIFTNQPMADRMAAAFFSGENI